MRLTPSRKRYWKTFQPADLRGAMDACVAYALEAHNLSIDRIAERMGLGTKWTLYKLIGELRMTAAQVRSFEHACGANYVSRYIAASAGLLAIEIPAGRQQSGDDIQSVQANLHAAVGALMDFHAHRIDAAEALERISAGLSDLAWHRENVARSTQPQLDFSPEGSPE